MKIYESIRIVNRVKDINNNKPYRDPRKPKDPSFRFDLLVKINELIDAKKSKEQIKRELGISEQEYQSYLNARTQSDQIRQIMRY